MLPTCTVSNRYLNAHIKHSLWHLRWLPKSIPHLLVAVQWMHMTHNVFNMIKIMLPDSIPFM